MKKININLPENSKTYPIYIGTNIIQSQLIPYCQAYKKKWIIITDSNLNYTLGPKLQEIFSAEKIDHDYFYFLAGEENKTRESKEWLEDRLLSKHYGRDIGIIALGGGIVTDLVGFLASTYCRGVPVIYVPTSLLAMVDASIGGKTGVNTAEGKNLIGTFYQPKAVFMDITLLKSLPPKEWPNGIVEMLKHGLINDAELFKSLQKNASNMTINIQNRNIPDHDCVYLLDLIYQSCEIKKNIVEQDERDLGIRQLLNFGHTIGHAIETLENYKVSHGEAVAIGMVVEAHLSALMGFLDISIVDEIENTLRAFQLPLRTLAFNDIDLFKKSMEIDKKSLGQVPYFVLLDAIGKTHFDSKTHQHVFAVDSELLDQALEWAKEKF